MVESCRYAAVECVLGAPHLLGLIAQDEGKNREALGDFMAALEIDPNYALARRDAGLLLYKLGDVKGALEQLKLYLDAAPAGEDTSDVREFMRRTLAASRGTSP